MDLRTDISSVCLKPVGYQFPEITDGDHDSNWLVIAGTVSCGGINWSFREPCLLTWELTELAQWLKSLSTGPGATEAPAFTEPNITVSVEPSGGIVFGFSAECRPNMSGSSPQDFGTKYVRLELSKTAIGVAAAQLHEELLAFPERGVRASAQNAG